MELERIATNTYDFETMRSTGITYVDKTGLLHPIADCSMGNRFFLARPRRFGKSLLVSTLRSEAGRLGVALRAGEPLPLLDWGSHCPALPVTAKEGLP